ncbi:helix-turn-helix transcriptional regulator [Amycolatopsis cynarae]|uniref:Helix-turn-helix transcriptional regulator n=1 Tax=Amycolatopsis cynarae TaxID=2995223 RepID=A0ABY7B4H6_9PSEU|nr:helix-turn-helix transcriptional regulator [Amycolatopsis sp. HUAS 11-8]WAL67086.1 helix-turn-helix transcriptional regulator [Amycolatopsis sp. HUAS 11-8]
MPFLNGPLVRDLAAEHGWDLAALADRAGIPLRTLQNITREHDPDPTTRIRLHNLAKALAKGRTSAVPELMSRIRRPSSATTNDGVPDEPPQQPTRPKGPARRQDTETTKRGPKRVASVAA